MFLADYDECVDKNGGCEQICNNIPGSFQCSCLAGFTLVNEAFCSGINNFKVFYSLFMYVYGFRYQWMFTC